MLRLHTFGRSRKIDFHPVFSKGPDKTSLQKKKTSPGLANLFSSTETSVLLQTHPLDSLSAWWQSSKWLTAICLLLPVLPENKIIAIRLLSLDAYPVQYFFLLTDYFRAIAVVHKNIMCFRVSVGPHDACDGSIFWNVTRQNDILSDRSSDGCYFWKTEETTQNRKVGFKASVMPNKPESSVC